MNIKTMVWAAAFAFGGLGLYVAQPQTSHAADNAFDAAGQYQLDTNENYDEYLKVVGASFTTRKMLTSLKPVVTVTVANGDWTIKTTSTFKTHEITFKLGQEFDETTFDGRNVKAIITRQDNTLTEKQTDPSGASTITRDFSTPGKMIEQLSANDVVAKQSYTKS